jgi:hypothetical protein
VSETFLTKEQGRKIAEIIGGSQGCGAIWNVIMGDLDNPYCDGFVIQGHNKERTDNQPPKRTSGVSREQRLGALVVHWRVLFAQDYTVVEGSAPDAFAICAKQLEGLLKSDEWAIAHWETGGMANAEVPDTVKLFVDRVKAELRRVSKGQMETWGFVQMFNDILDNQP